MMCWSNRSHVFTLPFTLLYRCQLLTLTRWNDDINFTWIKPNGPVNFLNHIAHCILNYITMPPTKMSSDVLFSMFSKKKVSQTMKNLNYISIIHIFFSQFRVELKMMLFGVFAICNYSKLPLSTGFSSYEKGIEKFHIMFRSVIS